MGIFRGIRMKGFSKVFGVVILCIAVLLSFSACSSSPKNVVYGNVVYGTGDVFSVKGVDDFVLDKIVLLPEYNTATKTGYGVVFLKKEASAPISFTMGSSASQVSDPKSLVDLTLMDGENAIRSANISFVQVDDSPLYKGSATFAFQIEDGKPFPAKGSFSYAAAGTTENQTFEIDLSNLAVPDADKESVASSSTPAPPEQQPIDSSEEVSQPSIQPTITTESTDTPTIAAEDNEDSLVFSEQQEYEGEIQFDRSANVMIHFYLAADGSKITQIDFSMDDLYLAPKDANSAISHINITDAALTHTGVIDVLDGNITSSSFFIFDLTVTRACIFGMISIEYDQEGTLMVNEPVYVVVPNITTPAEIPEEIVKP